MTDPVRRKCLKLSVPHYDVTSACRLGTVLPYPILGVGPYDMMSIASNNVVKVESICHLNYNKTLGFDTPRKPTKIFYFTIKRYGSGACTSPSLLGSEVI